MNRRQTIPAHLRYTIEDFNRQFPTDDACFEHLREQRFPDGMAYCGKCKEQRRHHRVKGRPVYACDECLTQISPMAGTIFEHSSTSLRLWYYAMYLMASTRCGISAKQIQRETGVTYKTAWRMFKQIRSMLDDEKMPPLGGGRKRPVEMDEMHYGGVRKGQAGRSMAGDTGKKVTVIGMVERKGSVRAVVSDNVEGSTMLGLVKQYVLPKSVVMTDEFKSYNSLDRHLNRYDHRTINHSEKIYVSGELQTNTIEGFWSLVKSGIRGVYHQVGRHY